MIDHAAGKAEILALALLALTMSGCDLFGEDDEEPVITTQSVVVANGGNFGDQNGYLSFYDPESGAVDGSDDLGGFAHAVAIRQREIFVLLNTFTTGRISIVDAATGTVVRQVQGLPGPRGIAFIDDARALVSNLSPFGETGPQPAEVSVIDFQSGVVEEESIQVGIYPEGLVEHGGRVFVANSGNLGDGTTLTIINVATTESLGAIDLGCDGPNEIFVDGEGELVVVCEGKVVYNDDFTQIIEQTVGQIVVVNPSTETVASRTVLTTQAGSENGSQSAYLDEITSELYVIDSSSGSIYRYNTVTNAMAAELQVPDSQDLVGLAAVAYDGLTEKLYIARLARGAGGFPDFSASGAVVVLDRLGNQIDRFTVGPAPSHIEFLRVSE